MLSQHANRLKPSANGPQIANARGDVAEICGYTACRCMTPTFQTRRRRQNMDISKTPTPKTSTISRPSAEMFKIPSRLDGQRPPRDNHQPRNSATQRQLNPAQRGKRQARVSRRSRNVALRPQLTCRPPPITATRPSTASGQPPAIARRQ